MKLLFLLILSIAVFSAEIDTKLYENVDKEAYYNEIEKQITIDANGSLRNVDIIRDERTHLTRLRDASSQILHTKTAK